MGLRGPAPKPTETKRLEDNPGCRRLNDNEAPFAEATDPEPCAQLSERARELWRKKVAAIGRAGIKATDVPALTLLVQTEAAVFVQAEQLAAAGDVVPTKRGGGRLNPARRALAADREFLLKLWARFGHTPSDRSRIMDERQQRPKGSGILNGEWRSSGAAQ